MSALDDECERARLAYLRLRARRDVERARKAAERKARNREILRLFDDEELAPRQIIERLGLSGPTVRNVLRRHGRTIDGRNAIKAQLAALTSPIRREEKAPA